jgi:pyruvate dehydrogenase E1 component beta subunit
MLADRIAEARCLALARAMAEDPDLVVLGAEDDAADSPMVGTLRQHFGHDRVLGLPVPAAVLGEIALGMAVGGLHPVAALGSLAGALPLLDQLLPDAAVSGVRRPGPLVLCLPYGPPPEGLGRIEAALAPLAGVHLVLPSSPAQAYRLLLTALGTPAPVIFLEPTRLHGTACPLPPLDAAPLPLGQAVVQRPGTALTMVAWGAMTGVALAVANLLGQEDGQAAEVIDLVSLRPLDRATILASVQKTGRCLILQDCAMACGLAAEIAAQIAEHDLFWLLAPVERVIGCDPAPIGPGPGWPNHARILRAARRLLTFV